MSAPETRAHANPRPGARRRKSVATGEAALVAGATVGNTSGVHRASEGAGAIRTADMQEDVTLVRRTLAGDQQAFTSLVDKYKDPVFNVAYRMLGNPTEAEDVAQEAFVRAYTQLHTYKEPHRFSTCLLSIAPHLSINQLRRRRFLALPLENVPFLEWIADVGPGPEQSALRHETADDMQRILDTLPVKYRAVLLLRYWHDFSYEEIAHTLDLTPALVKARLHRARELVARTMKAQGLDMTLASEETDEREHGKIAAGDVGLAAH